MAKSATADAFDALKSIYAADANKLGPSGSDANVRDFERVGVDRFSLSPPFVLVELSDPPANTMVNDERYMHGVFHVYTAGERPITEQDGIEEGIRGKYDQATVAGTDWTWSDCQVGTLRQQADDGSRRHATIGFVTMGTRN